MAEDADWYYRLTAQLSTGSFVPQMVTLSCLILPLGTLKQPLPQRLLARRKWCQHTCLWMHVWDSCARLTVQASTGTSGPRIVIPSRPKNCQKISAAHKNCLQEAVSVDIKPGRSGNYLAVRLTVQPSVGSSVPQIGMPSCLSLS